VGFDARDEGHAEALERLGREKVAWLTTVRSDGQPQSSPVWFVWDGQAVWVRSMPAAPKVANIRGNPRVAVHLDSDGRGLGGDVVIMDGAAELQEPGGLDPAYRAKYEQEIVELGSEPKSFAKEYSVRIRITPRRVRVS
jgi:PPOX class probable F420-dependent enzyme